MLDIPVIDFETEAIDGSTAYNPPKPVGVSIKRPGEKSFYYAWGHPTGNNCTEEAGSIALMATLTMSRGRYLAQNSAFEAAILDKYYDHRTYDPLKVDDSMFLIFLSDPYASTFSLKPSAERILGMKPEEQDAVKDWVLANVPCKTSEWGAHIAKAPGDLVGRYACGDTDRSWALYEHLHPKIVETGMEEAYQREQRLMPILYNSSKRGVRLDTALLSRDIEIYTRAKEISDKYIEARLGSFNIDSDAELAAALDKANMVTEWVLTPTGRRSTARKNLVGRVRDPQLLAHLGYRGVLATCLQTFAGPWLAQALAEGGRVHPQWNQVRGDRGEGGDMSGTRTGRMSCRAPNLQNPPNNFDELVIPLEVQKFFAELGVNLPLVPHMRRYLLPDEGHIWLKRDFSAQEMRIMAHFAEGKLYDAFHADPKTDPHAAVQKMIRELLGIEMPRKYVKITGFGIMYGRGVKNLSAALGVDEVEGKKVRDAYYAALPEIQGLSYSTRNRGKSGQFIRTWGGRIYYREPDAARDLSYKLLNYLIQGSAADQTKQSIIDYDAERGSDHHLLAAVHDEMNISVPIDQKADGMKRLRLAMDKDRFDVPFRSEGFAGPNWSDIEEYEA